MVTISLILLIAAFIVFVLAALNVPSARPQLVPLGLALWVLSVLLGYIK
jgi:hypothetical protein